MKKSIIAGASVLALAGAVMPMAGVFAANTDDKGITDTIKVTVDATCSFHSVEGEGGASSADETYAATVLNGAEAAFNNGGVHNFLVKCNDTEGYTVSATPTALTGQLPSTGDKNSIPYSASYSASGKAGMWTATAATSDSHAPTVTTPIPAAGGVIVTDGKTDGTAFAVTYKAYVGTETPADTYTGTMTYVLAER